ncbi:hypothetical protein KJ780_03560 [Candidatus Micrarchaeota archaeon]|nr:hypothetical protein [Candidatus Micrarchaeota archaeon]
MNEDEGFEEVGGQQEQQGGGKRPEFRVVQPVNDREGKAIFKGVGGMWKNISKNGNEFYTLKIGELKLLVFPNTPRDQSEQSETL